jgi:hypothetical protein
MFETAIEQLTVEEIYELGIAYYRGIYSDGGDKDKTCVFVEPDHLKSVNYFKMIKKEKLSGKFNTPQKCKKKMLNSYPPLKKNGNRCQRVLWRL